MKYDNPSFDKEAFTCPHCGVKAEMYWSTINAPRGFKSEAFRLNTFPSEIVAAAQCRNCDKLSLWVDKKMVYPTLHGIEPHDDMPEAAKALFREAQEVLGASPRSSCALLRLCLELLVEDLGGKGSNLFERIESLHLPPNLAEVFKACRIAGNQAAHPGVIDFSTEEGSELALTLSEFINLIVAFLISPGIQAQRILERVKKA
ncbi:DUF4145 domain-containing protein [uncultured Sutterella sp.]|jgi:hypothetical protein E4_14714|uniref:DUF4145 domain-containing protein n=1 Tax=uncultured Sutterella sp. TaxID=286133 RepID=UPI00266D3A37|nr:DUF4145 domain-containing protein [uncultured Sutterella sp.]